MKYGETEVSLNVIVQACCRVRWVMMIRTELMMMIRTKQQIKDTRNTRPSSQIRHEKKAGRSEYQKILFRTIGVGLLWFQYVYMAGPGFPKKVIYARGNYLSQSD